jgi:hypothetical protein
MNNDRAEASAVLGEHPSSEVADYLESIGDLEAAQQLRSGVDFDDSEVALESVFGGDGPRPWQHTNHAFGYVPLLTSGGPDRLPLQHVSQVAPSTELIGKRISVTLDRLRIKEYPGKGTHNVSFNFIANHQVAPDGTSEEVQFSQLYRVQDDQGAGITGYPVFHGLAVGNVGVAFKGFTVNVSNESDEAMLGVLDSQLFKNGLKLITTANPAIQPLAGLAQGVAQVFLSRNKNRKIQDFYLGLDFTDVATRARLAVGSYVVVQHPRPELVQWHSWVFDTSTGEIVANDGFNTRIPFNYIVFSVSEFLG